MPNRIQRSRTKGWKMPGGAIYVGRGSRWGNPFSVDVIEHAAACGLTTYGLHNIDDERILSTPAWSLVTAEIAVLMFRRFVELVDDDTRKAWLAPLRSHDLACWCQLSYEGHAVPCHADVLLELANRDAG